MPGPMYHEVGDPSWARWQGTAATSSAPAAASPWPSSVPVAVSGVQPAGPWAAALPQMTTPAGGVQQAAAKGASAEPGQASAASQPAPAAAGCCEPVATSAVVVEKVTQWSKCGDHYIVEWQYDDWGWWRNYTRDFSDRLEQCYQLNSMTFRCKPRGNIEFVYNVDEFWQMNMETQGRRLIRRNLILETEWLRLADLRAAVEKHNLEHHNLGACHNRAGRRPRSQSAAGSQRPSRSRAG